MRMESVDGVNRALALMERYTTTALYTNGSDDGGLGHRRHAGGVIIASQLVWPQLNVHESPEVRPPASAAHQRCDLCVRRLRLLFATSSLRGGPSRPAVRPETGCEFTFWGWQLIIVLGHHAPPGYDQRQEYGA